LNIETLKNQYPAHVVDSLICELNQIYPDISSDITDITKLPLETSNLILECLLSKSCNAGNMMIICSARDAMSCMDEEYLKNHLPVVIGTYLNLNDRHVYNNLLTLLEGCCRHLSDAYFNYGLTSQSRALQELAAEHIENTSNRILRFYMDDETEQRFLEYCSTLCLFYAKINKKVTLITSLPKKEKPYDFYLYNEQIGDLIINKYPYSVKLEPMELECIDKEKSSVIHFRSTQIDIGRKQLPKAYIWMMPGYYDLEYIKYIKKPDEFISLYNKLADWIKKNVPCKTRTIEIIQEDYISDSLYELVINEEYNLI